MNIVRVALLNDFDIVVTGMKTLLSRYPDRVKVVDTGSGGWPNSAVDIALFDTFAHPHNEFADARELKAHPLIDKVVMYTWALDDAAVKRARKVGASGCVGKTLPIEDLVNALERIESGTQEFTLETDTEMGSSTPGAWPGQQFGLTQREAEVLALIVQGWSNAEIANHCVLSINSVKTYIRSCYRRICVTTRAQAVAWGMGHGFVPEAS